jgi:hypothetical protein
MGGHIVKSIRRIAGLLIAMTALAFLGAGSASATEFPPAVGNGGSPFRDLCPAGQYLVGTNAHTGAVIDQISITCAPLKADGMVGVLFHGPTHGGPGGGTPKEPGDKNKERRTTCADNEIVNAMGLLPGEQNSRQVVRLIVFNCVSTTGTARHNLDIGDAPLFPTIEHPCLAGEAAIGLQGRAGAYVDALGLICGPFTKIVAGNSGGTNPGSGSGGCSGLAGEELAICNEHNVERAKHGVTALNWSADLAKNAQAWVNACHTAKNSDGDLFFCHQSTSGCGTDASYHYGENLSFGYPSQGGKEAVDNWYCEINVYDFDHPEVRGGTVIGCNDNPKRVTGHFTQVVWRESTKLGCARNTCSLGGNTGTLWACEYDPPGNFNVDQPGVLDRNVPKPLQGLAATRVLETGSGPQKTTAIISDVDLYDIPGGVGKVIGVLRKGQKFPLVGCRADDWCQLSSGWVWGSFIVRSHTR